MSKHRASLGWIIELVDLFLLDGHRGYRTPKKRNRNTYRSQVRVGVPAPRTLDFVDAVGHLIFRVNTVNSAGQKTEQKPFRETVLLPAQPGIQGPELPSLPKQGINKAGNDTCLLYTSDAADE